MNISPVGVLIPPHEERELDQRLRFTQDNVVSLEVMMGLRRTATMAIATLAALAITPMAQAGTAAPPRAAPLSVEVGQVRCQDLSALAELSPLLAETIGTGAGGDLDSVPSVRITIEGGANAESTPFEVRVDGEVRSTGVVGSGGTVITGITLPNDTESTLVVESENTVVLERTITPNC